jgi:hypothetical protein
VGLGTTLHSAPVPEAMEELLRPTGAGALQHPAFNQGQQHALFRSVSSSLQHQHSDVMDAQSEGSECCTSSSASPLTKIKTAKAILAIAAAKYTPALARPGHSRGGVAPGRWVVVSVLAKQESAVCGWCHISHAAAEPTSAQPPSAVLLPPQVYGAKGLSSMLFAVTMEPWDPC